ncbi:MAG TPA: hypothetical protein VM492_18255, partial [Sumerlaeia bacterium]|nr:hypothetical protein [Sumerlaeia bacterium]
MYWSHMALRIRSLVLIDDNGNRSEWTCDAHGRKIFEVKGLSDDPPGIADRVDGPSTMTWTFNDAQRRVLSMKSGWLLALMVGSLAVLAGCTARVSVSSKKSAGPPEFVFKTRRVNSIMTITLWSNSSSEYLWALDGRCYKLRRLKYGLVP